MTKSHKVVDVHQGQTLVDAKNEFMRALAEVVFDAAAKQLPETFKESVKKVTGSVDGSMEPVDIGIGVGRHHRTIMTIGKGAAAHLLQFGKKSKYWGVMGYPKFVSYDDEPHLKEWAQKVGRYKDDEEGLIIGGPNHAFGRPDNQWFSKGIEKTTELLKERIVQELAKKKI